MSSLYIDESVHEHDDFIVAACVYANVDLNNEIAEAIAFIGQDPAVFEYKSSLRYDRNQRLAELRLAMRRLLYQYCRAGLVIMPAAARGQIGLVALKAAKQFIELNRLHDVTDIYLDEGMVKLNKATFDFTKAISLGKIKIHFEQDSCTVRPLQLADLVAHVAAMQLKLAMHQPISLSRSLKQEKKWSYLLNYLKYLGTFSITSHRPLRWRTRAACAITNL